MIRVEDLATTRHVAAGLGAVLVGLGMLGFGVTGFNRVFAKLGEDVLGFELNPAGNLLHLALGATLLVVAFSARRNAVRGTAAATVALAIVGAIGLAGGIDVLGTNTATASLQLAVSVAGATLLVWSGLRDLRLRDRRAGRI